MLGALGLTRLAGDPEDLAAYRNPLVVKQLNLEREIPWCSIPPGEFLASLVQF
jgi:hypothetical protein